MNAHRPYNCFEYVGNLHVHSRYSDGAASVPEIARTAKQRHLDFVILNDHAHMTESLHLEDEGIYDGVLVLMALEIGLRDHHYLAYGLPEMASGTGLGPQQVIDRVNDKGGFGFLAHPFEKGMPFHENSIAYTWNDLSVTGYTGICIWNFSSRWKERVKGPLHGLFCLLFKTQTLKGPSLKTLSFYDRQCRYRQVAAIGGSDAHGAEFRWGGFSFVPLSYHYALNSINVHLLLKTPLSGEFAAGKDQILKTLREGRLFIAHENLKPAAGFRFFFRDKNGSYLSMGEEGLFRPGQLFVEAPANGLIRLVKDGTLLRQGMGTRASFRVEEAGVYRAEVHCRVPFFGLRPWIFSNPIYLRPSKTITA